MPRLAQADRQATSKVSGLPAQTAQFGATKNDHFGGQIADHIGASMRALLPAG
jgi:hypothetical protein